MIEFTQKWFDVGDKVVVVATKEQLEEIALDDTYNNIEGVVITSNEDSTLVTFGNKTRGFYNSLLTKVTNTYNDTPDPDTYSDEYIRAMNAAYGSIE